MGERCTNKDGSLPKRFARTACFEDKGHDGKCRFDMNQSEVDAWFANLNGQNNG